LIVVIVIAQMGKTNDQVTFFILFEHLGDAVNDRNRVEIGHAFMVVGIYQSGYVYPYTRKAYTQTIFVYNKVLSCPPFQYGAGKVIIRCQKGEGGLIQMLR